MSPATFAFQAPLSDKSVREAYFLGQRNDASTAAFFAPYLRTLPPPKTGPYVSEVEIYTPYVQVIERSRVNSVGYSAQQAGKDYRRRGDFVFVRVRIDFTSPYGSLELYRSPRRSGEKIGNSLPLADSSDFHVGLSQKDQWVEPLSVQVVPTCTLATGHYPFLPPDGPRSRDGGFRGHGYCYGWGSWVLGWLVWLEYDARDIAASDEAQVEVFTADGQHVVVPFDFSRLR